MLRLLTALAMAAAQPPAATTSVPGLPGIWEGTVGTLPVRACFVTREWGSFGAYYYTSRLKLLGLEAQDGTTDSFGETGGDVAGVSWRTVRVAGGTLTAHWVAGRQGLPVLLHRVPATVGEEGACANIAFHQPRLAGVRTTTSRATVDGTAYTKLTLDTAGHFEIAVQTFALDGDSAAVRRINTAVGEELAGTPPRWFECISNSLSQTGIEGSESETLEPAMSSGRWLSVAGQYDSNCGGTHPNEGNYYRLFDLTSGAEINLLDWFLPTAVKREHVEGVDEDLRTLEPAFRNFLLTGWHSADAENAAECESVLRDQEDWNAGLTREGVVFTPDLPHVVTACSDTFTIDFDRLQPWLTPQAREQVRALRAERG